jgi:hypothetical protein
MIKKVASGFFFSLFVYDNFLSLYTLILQPKTTFKFIYKTIFPALLKCHLLLQAFEECCQHSTGFPSAACACGCTVATAVLTGHQEILHTEKNLLDKLD